MSLGGLRVYGHSLERTDQVPALLNERGPATVRNRSHITGISRARCCFASGCCQTAQGSATTPFSLFD